ncbi:MAG: hypothetical protein K2M34_03045 [Alphaproteobacteria bacterium]|nr:hypothetical protein [Alphaproteobacteria bacterium]
MNKKLLIVTMSTFLTTELAYAQCGMAPSDNETCASIAEPAQNIAHCKQYMFPYSLCYINKSTGKAGKFQICHMCEDGYILTLDPDFVAMGCSNRNGGVYVCQPCSVAKTCDPNSEIEYDEDAWKDSWNGYQTNTWTECNTSTCTWEKRSKHRCAAGFYGSSSAIKENYIEGFGAMGMTGCTQCPMSATTKAGESDPGANETIQGCYLTESQGYDVTGVYQIVPAGSRCYYE